MCTASQIRATACDIGDPVGHGTHVAGIAAGNAGIAPGADIAVVRSDTFTRLADAVEFLTDVASRRGEPIAINISVGGHYGPGPHDGHTPLESFLADHLGPGQVLVAAAGNDGVGRLHAGVDLQRDASVRVGLSDIRWDRRLEIAVNLWSPPSADVGAALELWVGDRAVVALPLDADGGEFLDGALSYAGSHLADIAFGSELADEHGLVQRTVLIDPQPGASWPEGATLAIALSGSGRVDGWISQTDYRPGVVRFAEARGPGWIGGDGISWVTVPATSATAIAVGSYSVRTRWVAEDAVKRSTAAVPLGSLSRFSSHGPTLAPAFTGIKPDLVAPGSMIISARAVGVAPAVNTIDAAHMVLQGTSMAAPHVTGVVALMLEANPRLDTATARTYLQASARGDGIDTPLPSATWGFGKLDAVAAVRLGEANASGCGASSPPAVAGLLLLAWLWRRRGAR